MRTATSTKANGLTHLPTELVFFLTITGISTRATFQMDGSREKEEKLNLMEVSTMEIGQMEPSKDQDATKTQKTSITKENGQMTNETAMDNKHIKMVTFTVENSKMISNMEPVKLISTLQIKHTTTENGSTISQTVTVSTTSATVTAILVKLLTIKCMVKVSFTLETASSTKDNFATI